MTRREKNNLKIGNQYYGLRSIAAQQVGLVEASVKVCHNEASTHVGKVAPSSDAVLMMPTERYVTRKNDISHDEGRLPFSFASYLVKHDGRNWVNRLAGSIVEAREAAG